jgi:hypothetical protein
MSHRILTVLEKVCKFKDIFEWEVRYGRYIVTHKTPNNGRHSYDFKHEHDSELLALEREIAKIEYYKGSQYTTDEVILQDFVEQYHELRARFPGVNVYGIESACGARVFAEIDHGYGRRVVKQLED